MYNVDKYFDFEDKSESKPKKSKKQKETLLVLLLLATGAYYYFMVYLPEEERKVLENQIQTKLDEVKNLKAEEYASIPTLLITLQGYLE
jgi:hypothetical protein